MTSKARLTLGTAALCGLVLLPFVALIASREPVSRQPSVAAPPADATRLIRRQQFRAAYGVLAGLPAASDSARGARHQYRLAICERALGLADSAYARLLRLEGQLPALEDYRRLWVARSLQVLDEPQAAAELYRQLLAGGSASAVVDSARLYLAEMHETLGEHGDALALYGDHRGAAGPSPALLFRIAEAHRKAGDEAGRRTTLLELMERYPAHRLALDAAARFRPATVDERYTRAQVYSRHGDDRRAITELQQVLRNAPGHDLAPHAAYALGRAFARSGQRARARHTFQRLYDDHGWPTALYRLAGLQVASGHDADAIEAYVDLARRYPEHELADDAVWQAAKAAERNDMFERAATLYAELARRYPSSEHAEDAAWGVGFSLYCQQRFEDARGAFSDLGRRARQPHMVDQSLYWAAKSAQRLGLEREAHADFAAAAQGFPRSYYASRAVSRGYGPQGWQPPAAGRRVSLASVRDDVVSLRGADHVQRALLLGELGLAARAEDELRQAEAANKGDPGALGVLRDGYEAVGLHDRALLLSTRLAGRHQREIHRLYPSYYWDEVEAAAGAARVDPYLVLSVIRQESFFNEDAVSRAGALGLMQIMPQTGRKLATRLGVRAFDRRQLFDPGLSIQLGSRFLGDQVRSFSAGDATQLQFQLGLAAYNAGPRVARRWLERFPVDDADAFVERIPYRETRLYVKKVLKNYTIYRALNGSGRPTSDA